jgi:hypothetical protein
MISIWLQFLINVVPILTCNRYRVEEHKGMRRGRRRDFFLIIV